MNVIKMNFDATMDDVYQKDGNVIRRKIVMMEVMKMQAIVVSLLLLFLLCYVFILIY